MSDTSIFVVGTISFLLLSGGWIFTVLEVQRLGKQATAQRRSNVRDVSSPSRVNEH
jgi:hypothetical protein